MIKTLLLAASLAVTAFSAQAATMKMAFTNVVSDIFIGTILGGSSLAVGDIIHTTYTYNTNDPSRATNSIDDRLTSPSAFLSVTVEFKGWTYSFSPNASALVDVFSGTPQGFVADALGQDFVGPQTHSINLHSYLQTSVHYPPNLEAPVTVFGDLQSPFEFDINTSDATTGVVSGVYCFGYVQSVTISAVPLPASLPLLMAGFGGLAALRRKKKPVIA